MWKSTLRVFLKTSLVGHGSGPTQWNKAFGGSNRTVVPDDLSSYFIH